MVSPLSGEDTTPAMAGRQDRGTLSLPCSALALSKSAGHDGPPLYPGPLCGGESGTTGRAEGVDRDVDSFSPGQDALSKSPAPAHGLFGQDAQQAPSEVAFLFGYLSLWPRKEKVTRLPQADERSCSAHPPPRGDSRVRCLPSQA